MEKETFSSTQLHSESSNYLCDKNNYVMFNEPSLDFLSPEQLIDFDRLFGEDPYDTKKLKLSFCEPKKEKFSFFSYEIKPIHQERREVESNFGSAGNLSRDGSKYENDASNAQRSRGKHPVTGSHLFTFGSFGTHLNSHLDAKPHTEVESTENLENKRKSMKFRFQFSPVHQEQREEESNLESSENLSRDGSEDIQDEKDASNAQISRGRLPVTGSHLLTFGSVGSHLNSLINGSNKPKSVKFRLGISPEKTRITRLGSSTIEEGHEIEASDVVDTYDSSETKICPPKATETDGGFKTCSCKSECTKLYCDCFAADMYCSQSCTCQDCLNIPDFLDKYSS